MPDMLHGSTQQHQCSHPAPSMLPEPPLLACYLQQLTHAPAELPFLSLYPSIAPRQQRPFLVPWCSSFPRARAHAQSPPSHPAPYSDSHQGTHRRSVPTPFPTDLLPNTRWLSPLIPARPHAACTPTPSPAAPLTQPNTPTPFSAVLASCKHTCTHTNTH